MTVAYGAADLLDQALAGVAAFFTTTVIDNSSDPAVAEVARRHDADYVDPGRNLGFGSGVNRALRLLASGSPVDVLVLNPDATISADGIRHLQETLGDANSRTGVISPSLVGPSGSPQREMWPFPTPFRCWCEALGLGRFNRSADFVVGAVIMLRWEAIREVGLFDERFFLYAEETDWQRRAADLGWYSLVDSSVVAVHIGSATSTHSERREALFHSGTEIYVRKWFGPAGWMSYRTAVIAGAAFRSVVLRGERASKARHRALLYLRGPRRASHLDMG